VTTSSVVEAFDVGKDVTFGFLSCCILTVMDEFGFERVEEALHRGIVVAVGLATHRGLEAGGLRHLAVVRRGILNAAIGMVDQTGARPLRREGHPQGRQRRWKSRPRGGRPPVPLEIRRLIHEMSIANPLWGAPRIHGELLKLDIAIGQTSVAKYMAKRRGPPSQGWKTFLRNHADGIAAIDLFVVPTISFRLLHGLLIMGHGRRQVIWFGVTTHPTAEWIANQLTEACGWEQLPRYLIRDRDAAYGEVFIRRLRLMGIRDQPTSPRSPWQNGYAERLIGSIRRECLDHVVVFGEGHLRHLLLLYMKYYNGARTHLSLEKDAPFSRTVERAGQIHCRPILGGLHHQYVRI
jgi:transposase InsO family protein